MKNAYFSRLIRFVLPNNGTNLNFQGLQIQIRRSGGVQV